jgi:hypothetical protein
MNKMTLTSRVGLDGVLTVTVSFGLAEANREVQITVEPTNSPQPALAVDHEAWLKFIAETAGRWQGELERSEQGEYEQREAFH